MDCISRNNRFDPHVNYTHTYAPRQIYLSKRNARNNSRAVSNTHGAALVSEQSCPFASIVPAQQSSDDNPGVPAHLLPPHGSQPETQQTVPSPFSRPTRPLLQVVFDVATARDKPSSPDRQGRRIVYTRDDIKQKRNGD